MNRSYRAIYVIAAVVVLTPVALRAVTWHKARPQAFEPRMAQAGQLPNNSNSHCLQFPRNVHISQRNTPALFGAKLIDDIPEHQIIANERGQRLRMGMAPSSVEDMPVGRALRLADGRIGRFGWKAQ